MANAVPATTVASSAQRHNRPDARRQLSGTLHAFAPGGLTGQQQGLDQLAFATHGHPRRLPEPLPFGHVRLGLEPGGKQRELGGWNPTALDAIEQMLKDGGRETVPADLRQGVTQMP